MTYDGFLGAAARLYADGHDLEDPLSSPVYGDFRGFSPTYLITRSRDMFLSDTARTYRKLRAAEVVADLHVYEGVAHADYLILVDSPESEEMTSRCCYVWLCLRRSARSSGSTSTRRDRRCLDGGRL